MEPKSITRVIDSEPAYREVKENGKWVIKLMRKRAIVSYTPGYYEAAVEGDPGATVYGEEIETSTLTFRKVWHEPATKVDKVWWEEV